MDEHDLYQLLGSRSPSNGVVGPLGPSAEAAPRVPHRIK